MTTHPAALVLVFAGVVVASCAVKETSPVPMGTDASATSATRVASPAAAARIAALRTRFQLPVTPANAAVARRAHVLLPGHANGEVQLEDETSHLVVRFALDHVHDTPIEIEDGIALYRGALNTENGRADLLHRVHAEGTEDYVVFETRPVREELSYSVDVSRVPGLRLVSNTLEFLDEAGTPLLRVAPPYVIDSASERHEAWLAVEGCAFDTSPAGPWGRSVTRPEAQRCTVHVRWHDVAYPAMVDPAWTATGAMITPRIYQAATTLASGKVLVTGGFATGNVFLASAELFDPAGNGGAGTFAATGSMAVVRTSHTMALLPSGKVLVSGGWAGGSTYHTNAELYDPAGGAGAGSFVATGSMGTARQSHSLSVLPSGKVLVAGGFNISTNEQSSAEVFDPAGNGSVGTFTATASMANPRNNHTASVLGTGKVLIAGGYYNNAGTPVYHAASELFDPAGNGGAGSFAATSSLATGRHLHIASVLPSGKVLVAGGYNSAATPAILAGAELFDPAGNGGAGTFALTGSMAAPRQYHTGNLLPSGKVLVAGGVSGNVRVASTELFDPAGNAGAGAFSPSVPMASGRQYHTASLLLSGKVLVVGGLTDNNAYGSPEIYGGSLGDPCQANAQCFSAFCADGFCCNSACSSGGCDRCDLAGKLGTCTIVPSGDPGAPACPLGLACDGVKAACPTGCTSDASCAAGKYCALNGICEAKKPPAAACNAQANCKDPGCRECTGACVGGLCCDRECKGTCEACAAALKQSAVGDGICGPTKDGSDPRNECAPSGALCGADGMCNGTGACRLMTPAGVSCAADGKVCDGAGQCDHRAVATCDGDHTTTGGANGKQQDCSPYKCVAGEGPAPASCRTACASVADCVAPTVCDATGKCLPPEDSGGGDGCTVASRGAPHDADGSGMVWVALGVGILARRRARRHGQATR